MSARPILGIIACSRPSGEEITQAVVNRYVEAAARHGDAAPLIIPARPDLLSPAEAAARIDGLLLTGSPSNVEPSRYGERDADGAGPFDPGRDAMSLGLIEAMIARGRPVFGICRGFQEMNVAFGGTLARDLGEEARALAHHAPADVDFASMFGHVHDVRLTPGGVLATGLGRESLRVSSVHFQGVGRLGEGLAVEAVAPDGVVEAVSATVNGAPLLGVQWHPEWGVDADAASKGFFGLLGKALRGLPLVPSVTMEEQA